MKNKEKQRNNLQKKRNTRRRKKEEKIFKYLLVNLDMNPNLSKLYIYLDVIRKYLQYCQTPDFPIPSSLEGWANNQMFDD